MTNVFVPYRNPVTGLAHHAQPGITKIPSPESLLFVGNSLFSLITACTALCGSCLRGRIRGFPAA